MPLVSILLPAYDAESTIRQAFSGLLRQTFADFEIVAVNDGSSDGTGAVLDRLAADDRRVRTVHIPHSGLVDALNVGLGECRGEFIARMDADDYCHPERLRSQIRFLRAHPDVSVCGCLVRSFPRSQVKGGFLRYEEWLNSLVSHEEIARDIFVESPLAHPSVMMRAGDLRDLGGYRDMGWPEDYDLWLRFHMAGKRFGRVPEVLLFWREHADRLTFTDPRYALENFMRLKAHFLADIVREKDRPLIVWGAGMTGRRLTKHLIREGTQPIAIVDIDPRKIGRIVRGAPVIRPEELDGNPEAFIIAAVGSEGARELIRARLRETGRTEVLDFICAA